MNAQVLLDINWNAVGLQAGQLILSLSILVILHELGHFIPAKIFGCRVEKFYLFFDPWFSIVKKKVGDTVYGIGWLPLGEGAYLHVDDDNATQVLVVGVAQAGDAVLLVG